MLDIKGQHLAKDTDVIASVEHRVEFTLDPGDHLVQDRQARAGRAPRHARKFFGR